MKKWTALLLLLVMLLSFSGCTAAKEPVITGAESTAEGLKLSWNAVEGVGKYRLYVKTSTNWVEIGTTEDTSFTWTGAKTGIAYTFTLRSMNASESVFLSYYNEDGWRFRYWPTPQVSLAQVEEGIQISWDPIPGAEAYRVYAMTSQGWRAIGNVVDTSYVWEGAKPGYTYYFTVRCVNADGTTHTSAYNDEGWSIDYQ